MNLVKMKKFEKVPDLGVLPTSTKSEDSLQVFSPTCTNADYRHCQVAQHAEPEDRGATAAGMNRHHQPFNSCCLLPAETRQSNMGADFCFWDCGLNQCGSADPDDRDTVSEDECIAQLESDEEELELPLPLRSDDEWQHYGLHHHHTHNYGLHHPMFMGHHRFAVDGYHNCHHNDRYEPQPRFARCQHNQPWAESQYWFRHHNCGTNSKDQGSVSVNMPQFSVPPVEGVSEVSVKKLGPAGAETSVSHSHEKTRTISLPDEHRNIFITYSSDASSEIPPFADFLAKQGFRPAVDIFDNSVRPLDINKWEDSYLNDPSNLIIIAISPKYKADIEGFVVDSLGLHTKYIHSMMQNEFIQQGSLNFRFIPVLFLNASQSHVPNWLQNTCVYRWPQDADSLLLRLLRVERYVPPPVPLELTLIIKPVAPSSAAAL